MKKKFDFVIKEDKGFYRDIFRFYPKYTHVHGFHDKSPKSWKNVYKVYYSWAIFRQYCNNDTENKIKRSKRLFGLSCDECSQIPNLSEIIKHVVHTGETFDEPTFGQPAGEWKVQQRKGYRRYDGAYYEYYDFEVFDNWTNQGYRFTLDNIEVLDFCNWLDGINDYALKHSEGI